MYKCAKMTGNKNNHNLDLVNMNAHTKFGKILLFCSQYIERKRNFEQNSYIKQGP